MRRLKRLWCRLVGHDPVRLQIGPFWMDACLRCRDRLGESDAVREIREKPPRMPPGDDPRAGDPIPSLYGRAPWPWERS